MRQRLGIANALLSKAEFIILDEPTNGLDPSGIIELRNLILSLNENMGITFLISSHHISEILNMVSKIGIVKNGKMVQELEYQKMKSNILNFPS